MAIVTGGAGGIGAAVVKRFLNDGASVAIVDTNCPGTKKLCQAEFEEEEKNGTLTHYCFDVSNRQDCFDGVDKIVKDMGKVNFLFNAAATFKTSVSIDE